MSLGRKLQSAAPTVHRILAVELPDPELTAVIRACAKNQKRPPEFDRELEEFPGKAGGLLMHILLAQGPPVISQAMFEQDLCHWKLEQFSHGLVTKPSLAATELDRLRPASPRCVADGSFMLRT